MSYLKINSQLFIGAPELNRLVRFLADDGYKTYFKSMVGKFGIVNRLDLDPLFTNLAITKSAGTPATKISILAGFAIDSDLNVLYTPDTEDVLTIPSDNTYRYIIASYASTNNEVGTVDIATSGQITGTGTFFTGVLRGQPNFPTKIRFPNSSLNTGEYEVVTITNDTDATISGALQAESGQAYIIVGTFTPDQPVPAPSKDIFVYDSIQLTLSTTDTSVPGQSFALAKAKTNGSVMTLLDVRTDFLETLGSFDIANFDSGSNPLIGLEEAKYEMVGQSRDRSYFKVGLGFTATSWTTAAESRIILVTIGNGGSYKDIGAVGANAFNGWRVYFANGKSTEVVDTVPGVALALVLREWDADTYPSTGDIVIAPQYDHIDLKVSYNSLTGSERIFTVPVSQGYARIPINNTQTDTVAASVTTIQYRPRFAKESGAWANINAGTYYKEDQFDDAGAQTGFSATAYTAAAITPMGAATDEYYSSKAWKTKTNLFSAMQLVVKGADAAVSANGLVLATSSNSYTIATGGNVINHITTPSASLGAIIVIQNSATGINSLYDQSLVGGSVCKFGLPYGMKHLVLRRPNDFVILYQSEALLCSVIGGVFDTDLGNLSDLQWLESADLPTPFTFQNSGSNVWSNAGGANPNLAIQIDYRTRRVRMRGVAKNTDTTATDPIIVATLATEYIPANNVWLTAARMGAAGVAEPVVLEVHVSGAIYLFGVTAGAAPLISFDGVDYSLDA